jgi:hypothetical protein
VKEISDMSYSFGVTGASALEVEGKVNEELDKVVIGQPIHKLDSLAVFNATHSLLNLLRPPLSTEVVYANVSGSVWAIDASRPSAHSVGVNISVGFTQAPTT